MHKFRPLPAPPQTQEMLRRRCIEMQKMSRQSHSNIEIFRKDLNPGAHLSEFAAMTVIASATNSMRISQELSRERTAKERFMRGLDEGLVLDHIGPRCSFCGSCHNVYRVGGSHPYS